MVSPFENESGNLSHICRSIHPPLPFEACEYIDSSVDISPLVTIGSTSWVGDARAFHRARVSARMQLIGAVDVLRGACGGLASPKLFTNELTRRVAVVIPVRLRHS